jgi:hypothetical protein
MATPTYHTGDHVRSLVHRHGVLPISPGDVGTVTGSGIRNYIEPNVLVLMQVPAAPCTPASAPTKSPRCANAAPFSHHARPAGYPLLCGPGRSRCLHRCDWATGQATQIRSPSP